MVVSGWDQEGGGAGPAVSPKCKKKIEEEKCNRCDHTFSNVITLKKQGKTLQRAIKCEKIEEMCTRI